MAEIAIGLGIIILVIGIFSSSNRCYYCGSNKVVHKFSLQTRGVCLQCIMDKTHNA